MLKPNTFINRDGYRDQFLLFTGMLLVSSKYWYYFWSIQYVPEKLFKITAGKPSKGHPKILT